MMNYLTTEGAEGAEEENGELSNLVLIPGNGPIDYHCISIDTAN